MLIFRNFIPMSVLAAALCVPVLPTRVEAKEFKRRVSIPINTRMFRSYRLPDISKRFGPLTKAGGNYISHDWYGWKKVSFEFWSTDLRGRIISRIDHRPLHRIRFETFEDAKDSQTFIRSLEGFFGIEVKSLKAHPADLERFQAWLIDKKKAAGHVKIYIDFNPKSKSRVAFTTTYQELESHIDKDSQEIKKTILSPRNLTFDFEVPGKDFQKLK